MPLPLEVVNIALEALGEPSLSAVHDAPIGSRLAARLPQVAREAFEAYPWNFASRREKLARLPEEPIGFEYAYALPAGALRIVSLWRGDGDQSSVGSRINEYAEEYGRILCNYDEVHGLFTFDHFVNDLSRWPQVFAEAIGLDLAARENRRTTQSGGAGDVLAQRAARARMTARAWDAQRNPWRAKPVGRFVSSRWHGSSYDGGGRY